MPIVQTAEPRRPAQGSAPSVADVPEFWEWLDTKIEDSGKTLRANSLDLDLNPAYLSALLKQRRYPSLEILERITTHFDASPECARFWQEKALRVRQVHTFCLWAAGNWSRLTRLGQYLAFACAWRGITPTLLAEELGLSSATPYAWMTRDRCPWPEHRKLLAQYFKIDEQFLIDLTGESWEDRRERDVHAKRVQEPPEIRDYFDLTAAMCRSLLIGRSELSRRFGWYSATVTNQQREPRYPQQWNLPPVCAFVVEEVPDLIPDPVEDPQAWLMDLIPQVMREDRKAIVSRAVAQSHTVRKERVRKWTLDKLETEVRRLLGHIPTNVKGELNQLPHHGPVGIKAHRIMQSVNLLKARRSSRSDPDMEARRKTAAAAAYAAIDHEARLAASSVGQLRWRLESGGTFVYQCAGCGSIGHKLQSLHRRSGPLARGEGWHGWCPVCQRRIIDGDHRACMARWWCPECRRGYQALSAFGRWTHSDFAGPPPRLPRRVGRTMPSEDARDQLWLLLRAWPTPQDELPRDLRRFLDRLLASHDALLRRIATRWP